MEILEPLVEDGTITDEQAAAVALHLAETVPGRAGRFIGRGLGLASFGAAAELLRLEPSELREALADGSTLAEVAEAQGIEAQALIDGLASALEEKLNELVESGKLTDEQAAEMLSNAPERIENFVNSEVRVRRGFWLTPGDRQPEADQPSA